jgi:hypothetical protein
MDPDSDSDADPDTDADTDKDVDADVDADVDDTGTPFDCFDDPPRVEIGTGEVEFRPLLEMDPVVMVHGPQGGWHMLGSVRVHSVDHIIEVQYTIHDELSGVRVSNNIYRVAVVQDRICSGFYPGMYGYLDVVELVSVELDTPPELIDGHTLIMTMSIEDYVGRKATQELRVVAKRDPSDIADTGAP